MQELPGARGQDVDGCKKGAGAAARARHQARGDDDVNKHNFLVRDGHDDVVLADFEAAKRECSSRELDEEMRAAWRIRATEAACGPFLNDGYFWE